MGVRLTSPTSCAGRGLHTCWASDVSPMPPAPPPPPKEPAPPPSAPAAAAPSCSSASRSASASSSAVADCSPAVASSCTVESQMSSGGQLTWPPAGRFRHLDGGGMQAECRPAVAASCAMTAHARCRRWMEWRGMLEVRGAGPKRGCRGCFAGHLCVASSQFKSRQAHKGKLPKGNYQRETHKGKLPISKTLATSWPCLLPASLPGAQREALEQNIRCRPNGTYDADL